ncbi:MAG TPA: hypothetical protein V6C78_21130 [Crinalium sp.]
MSDERRGENQEVDATLSPDASQTVRACFYSTPTNSLPAIAASLRMIWE